MRLRRPLPAVQGDTLHIVGVGDNRIGKHGSSIDELREDSKDNSWEDPKEFLADTFAGFILMPTIGLRGAFAARDWAPETADARQMYTIACDFGVGYATLLTHLSLGVNVISRKRAAMLQRATPKALRAEFLGVQTQDPLVIADLHQSNPTIDAEVGTLLLLPHGVETSNDGIVLEQESDVGNLFRAIRTGIVQVHLDGWSKFVRIAAKAYVGLARYRHLEDDPDE